MWQPCFPGNVHVWHAEKVTAATDLINLMSALAAAVGFLVPQQRAAVCRCVSFTWLGVLRMVRFRIVVQGYVPLQKAGLKASRVLRTGGTMGMVYGQFSGPYSFYTAHGAEAGGI